MTTSDGTGVVVHSVCMQLGMSLAEYEESVGPKNQLYHEMAESVKLQRDGIIPLDDNPTAGYDDI